MNYYNFLFILEDILRRLDMQNFASNAYIN